MSASRLGAAFEYKMLDGKTVAMISHWGVFDKFAVPHEIGHILGASHGIQ